MSTSHKFALPPGFMLHQYRLERLLGHGGFGLTYLGQDTRLRRMVAIKELLPVDIAVREQDGTTVGPRTPKDEEIFGWARQRFIEEGAVLAACRHRAIVGVHDSIEEHGTGYLVTEFVEGQDMEQWLKSLRHPPDEVELRPMLMELLDGLEAVHQQGFLHRDIKPANILLRASDGLPVLVDFGNARQSYGDKTRTATAVLTPGYAPFEQYQTKSRQGPWTDLYALGAVMFRALTGRPPTDAVDRVTEDDVCRLETARPECGGSAFLNSIDRALLMNVTARYQSVAAWRGSLGQGRKSTPRVPGRVASSNAREAPRAEVSMGDESSSIKPCGEFVPLVEREWFRNALAALRIGGARPADLTPSVPTEPSSTPGSGFVPLVERAWFRHALAALRIGGVRHADDRASPSAAPPDPDS